MAAKTILGARKGKALESISERLKRIGESLSVEFPEQKFPKLPDELHRTTWHLEWCDDVLALIEREIVGDFPTPDFEDGLDDEDEE
jgi:hypothetical protein